MLWVTVGESIWEYFGSTNLIMYVAVFSAFKVDSRVKLQPPCSKYPLLCNSLVQSARLGRDSSSMLFSDSFD